MRIFRKLHLDFLCCLIYGLLSAIIIFVLTRGGITLSPDSINYLSIAKMINIGRWSESFVVTWPPFFPMLIALINSFGFEGEESARIISVISYSVLVMALFLLARATAGRLVAHLTSVSMLFFAPLLFVYSFCWSETVYITLSAISLLFLDKFYKSTDVTSKRYLIWGAIFVGLAFLTRYAGVTLFLAGFLIVGFKRGIKLTADKIKDLVLFSVITCTPITLYLIGCLHYKGALVPSANIVVTTLWQNLNFFFNTIYHDFLTFDLRFQGYVDSRQSGVPILLLGKMAGLIFLILCVMYFLLRSFKERIKDQVVPIIYVACYSLFIIIISTVRYRTLIESRLCSLLYPFIIVLMFFVIIVVCKGVARRRTNLLFWGLSIFAVLFFWSIQLGSTVNLYMQMAPPEAPLVEHRDITGDEIIDLSDLMYLINYLYRGGPRPRPLENANVNCDATIDIADVIYLVNYIYKAGPPPCNLRGR
ncbi:MAG: glycosyltransferase family 39 protein [candidate division Zixibacteria bacterium]|nr:glycosyltransferase family 39 protein [candidate division Zixibacteria bacterium]